MQKILGLMRRAIEDYKMINEGDKIAICLSGGKDSITRKFDSFNPLNVTKVLQTLYFFVKFAFLSCVSLRVVV